MELGFSDEQRMLAATIRRLCERRFPLTELRAVEAQLPGYSTELWHALIDIGVPGLVVPQSAGGLGLGGIESALVYEEFGRALAISPHYVSSMLAAALITRAADGELRQRWLLAIALGEAVVSVAGLEPERDCSPVGVQLRAEPSAGGWVLDGVKHFVPFANIADAIVVLARTPADIIVGLVVDAAASGISARYQPNLAGEPHFELRFDRVAVPGDRALNGGGDIWSLWECAMSEALIPFAAQAIGAASRVHEISVAYAGQREAFGRPIGGFQAVAHALADVIVAIDGSRTLVQYAAWARDRGRPFQRLAAMAKLQACAVFRRASAVAIQVHGGLGYTCEADPQLYFRRSRQWQLLYWNERYLEERIADMTLRPDRDRPVQVPVDE